MLRHLAAMVLVAATLTTVAVAPTQVSAAAAKTIEWKDLTPDLPPLKDPLGNMTPDQRYEFDELYLAKSFSPAELQREENVQLVEMTKGFEKNFNDMGIDVNKLIADVRAYEQAIEARGSKVRSTLNGKKIRMAGYLLPLNFSEKGETEFLLVPYVGACIHVPPPPANQLVYVRTKKPMKVKNIFTPVWINGSMKVERSKQKLNLQDGGSKVDVGYALTTDSVEPYVGKAVTRGSSSGQ